MSFYIACYQKWWTRFPTLNDPTKNSSHKCVQLLGVHLIADVIDNQDQPSQKCTKVHCISIMGQVLCETLCEISYDRRTKRGLVFYRKH